jgi:hypothetical protein
MCLMSIYCILLNGHLLCLEHKSLLDVHDCAFVRMQGAEYGAGLRFPDLDRLLVILEI